VPFETDFLIKRYPEALMIPLNIIES